MRFFEIILLSINTLLLLFLTIRTLKLGRIKVLITLVTVLLLHLIFEGYRWQILPSYLILLIVFWAIYKKYTLFKRGRFRNIIIGLFVVVLLFIGWFLPNVLPVFSLPTPTGKYNIGSSYISLITDRKETITKAIDDNRELMIKVWYPTKNTNKKTEHYLNAGDRVGFAVKYGLPKSTFNYLDLVKTHTQIAPAIADGNFPILIFSHGYNSMASGYYALIEAIVSHGYIVLNINHTYESPGALFPNGDIKLYDNEYDKKHNNGGIIWNAMQNYDKSKTKEEKFLAVEDLIRNYFAAEITERWSMDISTVVNALDSWDSNTFMANHMDLEKIGAFGHSQGGSAAAQALVDDKRIKAAINIDGAQWGKIIDTMFTKPFALISSEWNSSHPNFNEHAYHNGSLSDFYDAKILGSGHSSFMDIPLMVNLNQINEAGNIDPERSFEITTAIVLSFFDKYLLNKTSDLFNLNSKYPELDIDLMQP